MANLVDIVRDIIALIDLNIPVESTDGVRVNVCYTLHITIGQIVEDGLGNQYKVTDLSNNEWVDVTPYGATLDPFAGVVLVAKPVTYLHGSPSSTNSEYAQMSNDTRQKTPFIWLLESYQYTEPGFTSSIATQYDARLFFMSNSNNPEWINDEHNNQAIKPMENLKEAFFDVVKASFAFKPVLNKSVTVRSRFGVEITNKGSEQNIIDEDLSGLDVRATLEVYDIEICKC